MPDSPNRRWFQIHLSTAILLMFVAGGIIGQNVRQLEIVEHLPSKSDPWRCHRTGQGWPWKWYLSSSDDYEGLYDGIWRQLPHRPLDDSSSNTVNLFFDCSFFVLAVFGTIILSEGIIRRGALKKS
jgi:hypothetical protein